MRTNFSFQFFQHTKKGSFLQEWLTNSAHFPIVLIFLEMLLDGPGHYMQEPDLYALLFASLVQAIVIGSSMFRGRPFPLVYNLLGPGIYTLIEVMFEGMSFFESPYHIAYWIFSLLIGGVQQLQLHMIGRMQSMFILLEHLFRTNILLAMYWIFEHMSNSDNTSIWSFLQDTSHVFLVFILFLLGLLVGFANVLAHNYLESLKSVTLQLKVFSEWFLGKDLLSQAVHNPKILSLQRRKRALMFFDIRGFTSWSETQSPETVVGMLNKCFQKAEGAWKKFKVIKVKFTGDEIMIVFDSPEDALIVAKSIQKTCGLFLEKYQLSAGIGLHYGHLVEGVIGCEEIKGYDVIGDTVNTAKRICDNAKENELLISQEFKSQCEDAVSVQASRMINAKGKKDKIRCFLVES